MGQIIKLILVFYEMGRKYARDVAAGGGSRYVYSDDGNGNITISKEED